MDVLLSGWVSIWMVMKSTVIGKPITLFTMMLGFRKHNIDIAENESNNGILFYDRFYRHGYATLWFRSKWANVFMYIGFGVICDSYFCSFSTCFCFSFFISEFVRSIYDFSASFRAISDRTIRMEKKGVATKYQSACISYQNFQLNILITIKVNKLC